METKSITVLAALENYLNKVQEPAKGVRGNIFNDKLPLTSGSLYK